MCFFLHSLCVKLRVLSHCYLGILIFFSTHRSIAFHKQMVAIVCDFLFTLALSFGIFIKMTKYFIIYDEPLILIYYPYIKCKYNQKI